MDSCQNCWLPDEFLQYIQRICEITVPPDIIDGLARDDKDVPAPEAEVVRVSHTLEGRVGSGLKNKTMRICRNEQ